MQAADSRGKPWKRHTIDNSSRGADGVRVADVNGDGRLDFVTGWEEGGRIRVCINPGPKKAKQLWPSVTVGKVRSPEDAVFVDLDGDGAIDVVSCCEGRTRTMFVHWAPRDRSKYLDAAAWKTEPIPASKNLTSWMYCLPLQVDGKRGIDLVAGSKAKNAQIGWWESPENPRDLAAWKWHTIDKAGWVMSLLADDVDGDGDLDVVTSDRKGKRRGCRWLENPGPGAAQSKPWRAHEIGGTGKQVMFMVRTDFNNDKRTDYAVAVKGVGILILTRKAGKANSFSSRSIPLPGNTGTAKAVHVFDVDRDGRLDLVFTCENAKGNSGVMWLSPASTAKTTSTRPGWKPYSIPLPPGTGGEKAVHVADIDRNGRLDVVFTCANAKNKSAVMWLSRADAAANRWTAHEISGTKEGIKFDLIQLVDLDGDGDLDVITCEERDNLGVIWYENPTR